MYLKTLFGHSCLPIIVLSAQPANSGFNLSCSSCLPAKLNRSSTKRNAVPDVMSAALTIVAVGAAATALVKINQPTVEKKQICEACRGTGICPQCNGEGFIPKKLSAEETERARRNATNAATRYTASLPRKWNYCTTCSGARGCLICDGHGVIRKI